MKKIICLLPLLMSLLLACDMLTGMYEERWAIDYTSPNIGTLKYVPAGSFQRDGTPTNISTITKGFRMSQHEITQAQYMAVVGNNPSSFTGDTSSPVEQVNWYHVIAFCNKLSIAEGLEQAYTVTVSGTPVNFATLVFGDIPLISNSDWNAAICNWSANGYRLPTEMEWMWAAMGSVKDSTGIIVNGVNTTGYNKTFSGYTGSNDIIDYAWYDVNTNPNRTFPVGTKLPNELGLYDMSGNVWEWSWDWFAAWASLTGTQIDYTGASSGATRVLRGGSWFYDASFATVARRLVDDPNNQSSDFGFRVVRQ